MKMRYFQFFLLVILTSGVNAIDPSTPPDGNLYSPEISFPLLDAEVITDERVFQQTGLIFSDGIIHPQNQQTSQTFASVATDNVNTALSPDGYQVVLTGNADVYRHGIFGPQTEATGFMVYAPGKSSRYSMYELGPGRIYETLRPTIADIVPENPGYEILLTTSDRGGGARIEVYSMEGILLGASDPVGRGYRWIHLLAAAPFGSDRSMQVAAVQTPHIGGILQLYRWEAGRLVIVDRSAGFSTHSIGSRNLNTAIAGRLNLRGTRSNSALLLPSQDFQTLILITLDGGQIRIVQEIPLPSRLSSNLYFLAGETPAIWARLQDGRYVRINLIQHSSR